MWERFEMLLKRDGVTVSDVSKATGISQSVFSNWKKRNSNLSAKNAEKIANYFNVSIAFLMGVQEDVQPYSYYINEETTMIAERIFKNPELKMLFDATEDIEPADLKLVAEMVERLKKRTSGDR